MLYKQRPIPLRGNFIDDAAGKAHQQARRDERAQHDCEKVIARNAAGDEVVLMGAGSSVKLYHSHGRPVRWRLVRLVAGATVAGPIYESAAVGSNDGKTLTLVNDNAIAVTVVVEVF